MTVTLTQQTGWFAAYEGSLANCILVISENCSSPKDVIAFEYRSADAYTVVIKQSRKAAG